MAKCLSVWEPLPIRDGFVVDDYLSSFCDTAATRTVIGNFKKKEKNRKHPINCSQGILKPSGREMKEGHALGLAAAMG